MQKIVAIIGRPNVGKSTLFNRLTGRQTAIVHETPGVTRDRNYGEVEWAGKKFFLIDTGGYIPDSKDTFEAAIREQVKISIDEADLILFVLDARDGVTPLDKEISNILRKNIRSKKVIPVLNKVDDTAHEISKSEFFKLGLGEPLSVSALFGRRSGDLLDRITSPVETGLRPVSTDEGLRPVSTERHEPYAKFAIVGRPNVGKSSLLNAITRTKRAIVTEIPGTTRDSLDTPIKYYGKEIVLIDTAGLRKKSRIRRAESLEYYSAIRTYRSIERCDVAIIVIDALSIAAKLKRSSDFASAVFKLDKEDASIIYSAADLKKGILLAVNKWDLVEKESTTTKIFQTKIKEHLRSYDYLVFVFVSALTGKRVSNVLGKAMEIYEERRKEVKTAKLNSVLSKIIKETPPTGKSRKEIKINYITQLKPAPPVFAFYCNLPSEIQENYKRFLESRIRQHFGFQGVPITLVFKKKN